jgi:cell division topological specificity factor
MSLLDFFFKRKPTTANVAKERLQIILAHERMQNGTSNSWLPQLKQELLDVIAKYTRVDPEALKVNLEKRENIELLEINVTLPDVDSVENTGNNEGNGTETTTS